ncbi:MAG: hypothetical protein J3K34DRAFT_432988, partial [Monoraphidium minutum]
NAPRQREQAAVAPWGKPPKPMVLPPCAAPGNPPPGACGRSHPTSAGIDAAYCGSLGAAGGGQLGTAAATEQAAAGQNDARAQSTPGRTCTQDQVREGFTAAETAEHALLDCPAYADLRSTARFSPLFANPPAQARMRALAGAADQFALGAFVHACFERRTQSPP